MQLSGAELDLQQRSWQPPTGAGAHDLDQAARAGNGLVVRLEGLCNGTDGDAVRRMLVMAAVVVVLVGGAVAVVLLSTAPAEVRPADGPAQVAEGSEVAEALGLLATDPGTVIAAGALEQIDGRVGEAVPSGSTVRPFAETWAPDGLGGGTMVVDFTVPGGVPEPFLVVVVPEDGTWKVLATVPMVDQP